MSELLKIVKFVEENSPSGRVALARFSLIVGEDVTKISSNTSFDNSKVEKFRNAAEKITNKTYGGK